MLMKNGSSLVIENQVTFNPNKDEVPMPAPKKANMEPSNSSGLKQGPKKTLKEILKDVPDYGFDSELV